MNQWERIQCIRYTVLSILTEDIMNERYGELQKLCENLKINNKMLLNRFYSKRTIGFSFTNMIFYDMAYVVADKIIDSKEAMDLFKLLYSKRFPKIYNMYTNMENNIENIKLTRMRLDANEVLYFNYLIYSSEIFEPEQFPHMDYEKDLYYLNYRFDSVDLNLEDDAIKFNDDTTVFDSKLFLKYINKRKEEMATFLNIPVSELAKYIHNEMKSHKEAESTPFRSGVEGMIEMSSKNIINSKYGGSWWYELVTNDNGKEIGGVGKKELLHYVPDVDSIIFYYYKSLVLSKFMEYMNKKEEFNKLTLSRECKSPSPEYDYQAILYMYELDVFYKMFQTMMEKYYEDFSWEKITNQDIISRYTAITENLNEIINEKNQKISTIELNNSSLRAQLNSDQSKVTAPLVVENNKLIKIIDDKQTEIEELKRKLEYQTEFIELLSQKEEVAVETEIDLSELQGKRYLFVGHFEAALPELKHNFPNSIFMTTESTSISNIKVDGVVMLVRWMSHSMFYKIKASNILTDVPCAICNSKNANTIYEKMYKTFCE